MQSTSPVLLPEKLSLMGKAHSQTRCLPPAHCWCFSRTGVSGYLPFTPGQKSLWNCAGPYQGCLHTAMFMASLQMGPGQGHFGGGSVFRRIQGQGRSVSKVCVGVLWEGTWSHFRKLPQGWRGPVLRRKRWWGTVPARSALVCYRKGPEGLEGAGL